MDYKKNINFKGILLFNIVKKHFKIKKQQLKVFIFMARNLLQLPYNKIAKIIKKSSKFCYYTFNSQINKYDEKLQEKIKQEFSHLKPNLNE